MEMVFLEKEELILELYLQSLGDLSKPYKIF